MGAIWLPSLERPPGEAYRMGHPEWSARFDSTFVAIDFETATCARDSACAVAAVAFENGEVADRYVSLIQPPDNEYDPFNISIHGIGPSDTESSPTFPDVWQDIEALTQGSLVVAHHTAFDMSVLRRSSEHYDYLPSEFAFACTYRLSESHLPEVGRWRLDVLADEFDIPLVHHDPMSDAEAAGGLWLALSRVAGMGHRELLELHSYRLGHFDVDEYLPFSNAQSARSKPSQRRRFESTSAIDSEGKLSGKRVVLTGTLASMPRHNAKDAIRDAGGTPSSSVSSKTDYLVVGSVNLSVVGPDGMSRKHREAIELQQGGHPIQIIDEDDFHCLLANEPV
ncbi:MAG: exonuclease domain-containing protein [Acidimicrobiaceae bacterium]|nr:exonuclease domain-containing protein [Acidimicrobiaceae bacterium]